MKVLGNISAKYSILLLLSCTRSCYSFPAQAAVQVFVAGRVRLPKDLKVVIGRRRK